MSSFDNEVEGKEENGENGDIGEQQPEQDIEFERKIINEAMIRKAVVTEMAERYDKSVIPAEHEVNLDDVRTLCLSFKNVFQIDNLGGFEQLTKLQLDNNIIQKIEHLDHLVNLRWLDLSFNNIERIEGLTNLVLLEDLSLFNNKIRTIQGLDTLTKLNVLSLGNNRIEELEKNIEALRQFSNLRLLNLKGNAVCNEDDYREIVLANLGHRLKYLDYKLIDAEEATKAKYNKLEHINDLEASEKMEAEKVANREEKKAREVEMAKANLKGVKNLFQRMMTDDKEQNTLNRLPGYGSKLSTFQSVFQMRVDQYVAAALQTYADKTNEEKLFRAVFDQLNETTEEKCRVLIRHFARRKKLAFREFDRAWSSISTAHKAMDRLVTHQEYKEITTPLETLASGVASLREDLIEIEMLLVGQNHKLITEFRTCFEQLTASADTRIGGFFSSLTELEGEHNNDLTNYAAQLIDENNKSETPYEDEQQEAFLRDKDAVLNTISNSHTSHTTTLQATEDELRETESHRFVTLSTKLTRDEMHRNRHRMYDIEELSQRFNTQIAEKINEHMGELEQDQWAD